MYFHTDNNLLYYDNRSLHERFITKVKSPYETYKSILKGNIKIKINSVHYLNKNLTSCNGLGIYNKNEKLGILTNNPDYYNYYFDHYSFKSTQEFIRKINRGSALYGKKDSNKLRKIKLYFDKNEITLEKINYMEKLTKLNLSNYKNITYKNNKYVYKIHIILL